MSSSRPQILGSCLQPQGPLLVLFPNQRGLGVPLVVISPLLKFSGPSCFVLLLLLPCNYVSIKVYKMGDEQGGGVKLWRPALCRGGRGRGRARDNYRHSFCLQVCLSVRGPGDLCFVSKWQHHTFSC